MFVQLFLFVALIQNWCLAVELPAVDASQSELKSAFKSFVREHNKAYKPAEMSTRFSAFCASIKRAHLLNKQRVGPNDAIFGITPFSDLTPDEFRSIYLSKKRAPVTLAELPNAKPFPDTSDQAEPPTWDWRPKGAVTPIKNQMQCGSCWAFSTVENVESVWILAGKATNETLKLSEQQLLDCSDVDNGCDGGNPPFAMDSVMAEGGLMSAADYPYEAKYSGACHLNRSEIVAKISGYHFGNFPFNEHEMRKSLVSMAPLSVAVDAMHWQDYQSGVMTASQCAPWHIDLLDHAVSLVGYNLTANPPYYIVRNSWSPSWGMEGYIHLEVGHNTCGIAIETCCSYV